MCKSERNTGRTKRMLEDAAEKAKEGLAVYVIFDSKLEARRAKYRSDYNWDELGVKFESPESVGNLDWFNMRLRGTHPNVEVFIDHHAIENRFRQMLNMLHRYDKPNE